jgi:hypothetical protein
VAKRNSGRRARSRKRRPAPTPAGGGASSGQDGAGAVARAGKRERAQHGSAATGAHAPPARAFKDPQSLGERPQPPWHPLPLSELLILVGLIGVVVGLSRSNPATFLASLGAVLLGTAEVSWREHRSGYRSHTLILALVPAVAFHTAVILLLSTFVRVPRALNLGLLPVDGAIVAFLFKLLRARFQDARRERRFAGAR